ELASSDLAFPRSRLPTFRTAPCRTPLRQCLAACGQCTPSISIAPERYGILLAEPDGRCSVCTASDQRRVRGMGSRAEECVKHAVFPDRSVCLCRVCAPA